MKRLFPVPDFSRAVSCRKIVRISVIAILIAVLYGCSKSTDDLIQSLRSDSSRERIRAGVVLMGRRGNPETVQKMIHLLDDKDQRIVFIAIQILGSLADTTVVVPLGRMIDNPNPAFRARACYSLGSLGHESGLPFLVKALKDSVAEVRHSAVYAMGYLPHSNASVYAKHLYGMFRDNADSVRAAAIQSLYFYRNVKDSGILAADFAVTLNDPSELVRYVAVQALGGGFPDTTAAGDLLIEALKDENKYVRLEAIVSLKKIKYREAVPKLKEMYDMATVDEEFAITEAIKEIANETFPPI